jgi:hypothetical protein
MSQNNVLHLILYVLLLAGILSAQSYAVSITSCNTTIAASNTSFSMNNNQCTAINIVFARGVSNSRLACNNISLSSRSNIIFGGSNNEDYLFNCSFNGAKIILGNDSFADIVSPINTNFIPTYNGSDASITVGYFLNISVFEPFGSNSVAMFGNRIGAFSYILPLFNNSIQLNNTQLQMVPSFSTYILNLVSSLNKTMQFGVYGQNQSAIYENFSNRIYGNIFGYKKFMLPSYTLTSNGIINYNPYAIEYSFLGYDQLVMYFLNITKNTNLMPVYIEPIYPSFNYNIIPDNGQRNITIKWLVAVPPQDLNWNFSSYLYRYSTSIQFIMNPLNNSIQNGTSLVKLLSFPSKNYSIYENGTYLFYLNYSTKIGIGLNSSIMLLPGHIPGEGNFIQDSTTPSFSYGLSFCSTIFNQTNISNPINEKGTYTMSSRLFPLSGSAPILVNASCYIGAYITGTNITINCNNGIIADTYYAFIINNAKNVKLSRCNILGDGILVSNSTGISVYNTTIYPTAASSTYGINLYNSSKINFSGVKILEGFSYPYLHANSSAVNFYDSDINTQNTSTVSTVTTVTTTIQQATFFHENQTYLLYAASAAVLLIYIYLFFKLQYKPAKLRARNARKKASKKVSR